MNWESLADFLLNVTASVVISWLIAAYYFRKETRAEKIAEQIKEGVQKALFPIIYPKFFDPTRALIVRPNQPPPRNTDIPFIEYALFAEKTLRPGQRAEVLIKLKDSGFDLDNPGGVIARDHKGKPVEIISLGLGYARIVIYIWANDGPGRYELTVTLQDLGQHTKSGPNKNVQTLPFVVE